MSRRTFLFFQEEHLEVIVQHRHAVRSAADALADLQRFVFCAGEPTPLLSSQPTRPAPPSSAQYCELPTCIHLLEHPSRLPGRSHEEQPDVSVYRFTPLLPHDAQKPRAIPHPKKQKGQIGAFWGLTDSPIVSPTGSNPLRKQSWGKIDITFSSFHSSRTCARLLN